VTTQQTQPKLLRRREVLARIGLSAPTLYRMEKEGRFPKHALIGPRCAVWSADEVDAWIAQQLGTREGGA
jgi:prophage regulatory protein